MAGERINAGANLDLALELAKTNETVHYTAAPNLLFYIPPKSAVDYQKKFDPIKFPPIRPTRNVVVSQDPGADQIVPAGTEIKVSMIEKGTLPVGSFQVSPAFMGKYAAADVDMVLRDLDEKGQAVAPILQSEKAYEVLSQSEKAAVIQYASGIGVPAANEADAKAFFEDIQFFHNF